MAKRTKNKPKRRAADNFLYCPECGTLVKYSAMPSGEVMQCLNDRCMAASHKSLCLSKKQMEEKKP